MARRSTRSSQGQARFHPIACETCRRKKRKCDRELPTCGQCSNDTSQCRYADQGKRGLPLGFVSALEKRLAETENALYRVIQAKAIGSMNGRTSLSTLWRTY
ncbi:hypothetical protein ACCO45_011425 [Purpureocillium lilacinum]|uniref:Uncharacterized protein n=1 Tax=Purpureocillium lilacinum TaxID=33203 RepID=A0ACC4DCB7_PURLI